MKALVSKVLVAISALAAVSLFTACGGGGGGGGAVAVHPVIFVHGGPKRQMLLGYHYRHFYHMAYAVDQYFVNDGGTIAAIGSAGEICESGTKLRSTRCPVK